MTGFRLSVLSMAVPESKICNSVPQGFRGEGTFVLNCEHINRLDCNNDGLGAWGKPAGRNRYYGHSTCGLFTRMDDGRGNLLPGAKYIWKCMMRRYEHPMTAAVNGGESRFIKKFLSVFSATSARKRHPYVPGIPHLPVGSKDWQAASFVRELFFLSSFTNVSSAQLQQNGIMAALPATCSAYFGDCPIYAVGAIDFNAVASIILGGTIVESSKICNKVPQGYRECGTFVIDLCNFDSDAELRRDDNGCWGKPAGNSRYYKIDPNTGDAVRVDRGCKLIEGAEYDVQVRLISSLQERRTAKASVVFRFCLSATNSSEKFTLAEVLQIPGRCARCMHSVKSHTFFN
ncbi:unnamed protein product [Heligmosomoides polygyrus]|uniref:Uncharacterized protein n=1 Tax=Heligmosomoides polygyrus TaxID=6339 RepID=A0A3P8A098_HELPZ|nr:unnamed protein product [Heligmosomoides polygyrus]